MHIRHVVATTNFAGAESYVANVAIELARRGHLVDVIGGEPAAMRALLEPAGVSAIASAGLRGVAKAAIATPRPDLVHTHMTASDLVGIAARPFVRCPIVSTLHFAQPRGHDTITRAIYGLIPHLVHAQIAISATVAEAVGGRVDAVILNGVPKPHMAQKGKRANVVLVAQRLESEKDTATALRAFAASNLAASGWELHICGEGSELTSLKALAATLDIDHATTFFGRVDDLSERMSRAAIFLASATREPFGLSVVEAMACALPVVAADGGGHQETIGAVSPDTVFPPGDADAAGVILAKLANDPALCADLGARAHARYEESFTIEAHVDALEAFYTRILA